LLDEVGVPSAGIFLINSGNKLDRRADLAPPPCPLDWNFDANFDANLSRFWF
jgi:hypothetical protein